jgi:dTMP kinase
MNHLRGKFIVLDGGEGCGKSTQAQMLREKLIPAGIDVLLVRDPGTTRIGEYIREILLNPENDEMAMRCEMLLYMAARAQMMTETIAPALDAGKLVICDRFVSSTLAYQLGGDGLSADEIKRVADVAIKGRWPDLTLIFDMPVSQSSLRVKAKFALFDDAPMEKDRIERRSLAYHEQVRRNYLAQAEQDPQRYRVIAANRTPQEVHADVIKALADLKR